MGGNQKQQQSTNPFQGDAAYWFVDPNATGVPAPAPNATPFNPMAAYSNDNQNHTEFDLLMDDMYQRMKARAEYDLGPIGMSDQQGDSGEGF